MRPQLMPDDRYLTDDWLRAVERGEPVAIEDEPRPRLTVHSTTRNGAAPARAEDPPPLPTTRFRLYSDADIESMPPMTYLVPGVIPQGAIAAIYAPPAAGKSFVVLDLVLAVRTGGTWLGIPVEKGLALYIVAEGLSGLRQRVVAWKEARGFSGQTLGATFITETVNLMQPLDVAHLVLAARAMTEMPKLVVIDTLARSMPGGDENDTEDMSLVIEHASRIRNETGATVLIVHHTRKDSDQVRGSTALPGGVDTLMYVKEDDGGRTLTCEKQKDAPEFTDIAFDLTPVLDSCVIHVRSDAAPASSDAEDAKDEKVTPKRRGALLALRQSFTAEKGATTTEWLKASDIKERTFYRIRTWAVEQGHVTEKAAGTGSRYILTPTGKFIASDGWVHQQRERAAATATSTATASGARAGVGAPPIGNPPKGGSHGAPPDGPTAPVSGTATAANRQLPLGMDGSTDDEEARFEREAIQAESRQLGAENSESLGSHVSHSTSTSAVEKPGETRPSGEGEP